MKVGILVFVIIKGSFKNDVHKEGERGFKK